MGSTLLLLLLLTLSAAGVVEAVVEGTLSAEHSVIYDNKQSDSQFGYSLAAYSGQGLSYMIVGAPLQRMEGWDEGDKVIGGACRCSLRYRRGPPKIYCHWVPSAKRASGRKKYKSDGHIQPNSRLRQWMGATVSATSIGRNGYFTICAPRFVIRPPTGTNGTSRTAGECQLFPGYGTTYTTFTPCNRTDRAEYGQCLAGFSASIYGFLDDEGKRVLYFGAGLPGSFDSSGELFVAKVVDQKFSNSWTLRGEADFQQLQMADTNRTLYLGYSLLVTSLHPGQPQRVSLLAAAPLRGSNDWRGVVTVRDIFMRSGMSIADKLGSIGDYFGYSVAAADFNGDGVGDVAVGAPLHSNSSEGRVNAGRAYVFYGRVGSDGRYSVDENPAILQSSWPRGHFGHVVAAIGDLDEDGLQDLGIGCPYCGDGEVHVFLSRRGQGISGSPYQILRASDHLPNRSLKRFGWSIVGGVDFDNNGLTDVIVGASGSSSIVLYRNRPGIRLAITNTSIPSIVAPRSCSELDCQFKVEADLLAWMRGSKLQNVSNLPFEVTLDFDSLVKDASKKRVRLVNDMRTVLIYNTSLVINESKTLSHTVEIDKNLTDIITSIVVHMTVRPLWRTEKLSDAVLHPGSDTNITFHPMQVFKEYCGSDNICESDLRVTLQDAGSSEDTGPPGVVYHSDSAQPRLLLVLVENRGEMAFSTKLRLHVPKGVNIRQAIFFRKKMLQCSSGAVEEQSGSTLECLLGDLMGGKLEKIDVSLDLANFLDGDFSRQFSIRASLESLSEERPNSTIDNVAEFAFSVTIKTSLRLVGSPDKDVVFDKRHKAPKWRKSGLHTISSLGPRFQHTFDVINSGPSPIGPLTVTVKLPLATNSGSTIALLLRYLNVPSMDSGSNQRIDLSPQVLDMATNASRGRCQFSAKQPKVMLMADLSNPISLRSRRSAQEPVQMQADDASTTTKASVLSDVLTGQTSSQAQELLACDSDSDIFGSFSCGIIKCEVDGLAAATGARVVINGLLWADTMFSERAASVSLRSQAVASIKRQTSWMQASNAPSAELQQLLKPIEVNVIQHFFFSGVKPVPVYSMPWWAIVIAIVLGLLLLLIIALCMWRCGCFSRRRRLKAVPTNL